MAHYHNYWQDSIFLRHLYGGKYLPSSMTNSDYGQVYLANPSADAANYLEKGLPAYSNNIRVVSAYKKKSPYLELVYIGLSFLSVLAIFTYLSSFFQEDAFGRLAFMSGWMAIGLVILGSIFVGGGAFLLGKLSRRPLWLYRSLELAQIAGVAFLAYGVVIFSSSHFAFLHESLLSFLLLGAIFLISLLWQSPSKIKSWVIFSFILMAFLETHFFEYGLFSNTLIFLGQFSYQMVHWSPFLWIILLIFYFLTIALSLSAAWYRLKNNMLVEDGFYYKLDGFFGFRVRFVRIFAFAIFPLMIVLFQSFPFLQELATTIKSKIFPTDYPIAETSYLLLISIGVITLLFLGKMLYLWTTFYRRRDIGLGHFFLRDDNKLLILRDVNKTKQIESLLKYYEKNQKGQLLLLALSSLSQDLWKKKLGELSKEAKGEKQSFYKMIEKNLHSFQIDDLESAKRTASGEKNIGNSRFSSGAKGVIIPYKQGAETWKYLKSQVRDFQVIDEIHFRKGLPKEADVVDVVLSGAGFEVQDNKIRSSWGKRWGAILALLPLLFRYLAPLISSKLEQWQNDEFLKLHFEPIWVFTSKIETTILESMNWLIGKDFLNSLTIVCSVIGILILWLYLRGHINHYENYKYHFLLRWLKRKCRRNRWRHRLMSWLKLRHSLSPQVLILHDINRAPKEVLSCIRDLVNALSQEKFLILATWNISQSPEVPGVDGKSLVSHRITNLSEEEQLRILDDLQLLNRVSPDVRKEFFRYSFGIPERVTQGLQILKRFKLSEWEKWKRESLDTKMIQLCSSNNTAMVEDIRTLSVYTHYCKSSPPSLQDLLHDPTVHERNQELVKIFLMGWKKIKKLDHRHDKAGTIITFLKYFPQIPKPYFLKNEREKNGSN